MTRREFICAAGGTVLLTGVRLYGEEAPKGSPLVRFGMVTDLHYAALKTLGRRHYSDSIR